MDSMKKITSFFVLFAFVLSAIFPGNSFCQEMSAVFPKGGVGLTPTFTPAHLKGMVINPADPFKFDFIVDRGEQSLADSAKQSEYSKLIKYFLAALAVPDTHQWVNLSPYEKDRIIPDDFGLTEMGRELLTQDYLLKQVSASLTNPETELGKKFWDSLYERMHEKFGFVDVPTSLFNKVWLIPDKATLYEKGNMVYVVGLHLKVMTEADYLAEERHTSNVISHTTQSEATESTAYDIRRMTYDLSHVQPSNPTQELSKQILREIVIPVLEKEVNEGKNFAPLRQVYSGMLLATWFKRTLKESILAKVYADRSKVRGLERSHTSNVISHTTENSNVGKVSKVGSSKDLKDSSYDVRPMTYDPNLTPDQIWSLYVEAFRKGAYNLIKEDVDKYSKEVIPRKYFSGGMKDCSMLFDNGMITHLPRFKPSGDERSTLELVTSRLVAPSQNDAMLDESAGDERLAGHLLSTFKQLVTWPNSRLLPANQMLEELRANRFSENTVTTVKRWLAEKNRRFEASHPGRESVWRPLASKARSVGVFLGILSPVTSRDVEAYLTAAYYSGAKPYSYSNLQKIDKSKYDARADGVRWKLHLNVAPENVTQVSDYLNKNGFTHKYLSGDPDGEIVNGKMFTVFVGSYALAKRLASQISSDLRPYLARPVNNAEIELAPGVVARFDGYLDPQNRFEQYGSLGVNYLSADDSFGTLQIRTDLRDQLVRNSISTCLSLYGKYFYDFANPIDRAMSDDAMWASFMLTTRITLKDKKYWDEALGYFASIIVNNQGAESRDKFVMMVKTYFSQGFMNFMPLAGELANRLYDIREIRGTAFTLQDVNDVAAFMAQKGINGLKTLDVFEFHAVANRIRNGDVFENDDPRRMAVAYGCDPIAAYLFKEYLALRTAGKTPSAAAEAVEASFNKNENWRIMTRERSGSKSVLTIVNKAQPNRERVVEVERHAGKVLIDGKEIEWPAEQNLKAISDDEVVNSLVIRGNLDEAKAANFVMPDASVKASSESIPRNIETSKFFSVATDPLLKKDAQAAIPLLQSFAQERVMSLSDVYAFLSGNPQVRAVTNNRKFEFFYVPEIALTAGVNLDVASKERISTALRAYQRIMAGDEEPRALVQWLKTSTTVNNVYVLKWLANTAETADPLRPTEQIKARVFLQEYVKEFFESGQDALNAFRQMTLLRIDEVRNERHLSNDDILVMPLLTSGEGIGRFISNEVQKTGVSVRPLVFTTAMTEDFGRDRTVVQGKGAPFTEQGRNSALKYLKGQGLINARVKHIIFIDTGMTGAFGALMRSLLDPQGISSDLLLIHHSGYEQLGIDPNVAKGLNDLADWRSAKERLHWIEEIFDNGLEHTIEVPSGKIVTDADGKMSVETRPTARSWYAGVVARAIDESSAKNDAMTVAQVGVAFGEDSGKSSSETLLRRLAGLINAAKKSSLDKPSQELDSLIRKLERAADNLRQAYKAFLSDEERTPGLLNAAKEEALEFLASISQELSEHGIDGALTEFQEELEALKIPGALPALDLKGLPEYFNIEAIANAGSFFETALKAGVLSDDARAVLEQPETIEWGKTLTSQIVTEIHAVLREKTYAHDGTFELSDGKKIGSESSEFYWVLANLMTYAAWRKAGIDPKSSLGQRLAEIYPSTGSSVARLGKRKDTGQGFAADLIREENRDLLEAFLRIVDADIEISNAVYRYRANFSLKVGGIGDEQEKDDLPAAIFLKMSDELLKAGKITKAQVDRVREMNGKLDFTYKILGYSEGFSPFYLRQKALEQRLNVLQAEKLSTQCLSSDDDTARIPLEWKIDQIQTVLAAARAQGVSQVDDIWRQFGIKLAEHFQKQTKEKDREDYAEALNPGGIDFAQSNLDLLIKRDGNGVPLPVSQQNLDAIHLVGLVPVILKIQPASEALFN
nr:Hypothetical protein JG1_0240 [uncultured bacterium]